MHFFTRSWTGPANSDPCPWLGIPSAARTRPAGGGGWLNASKALTFFDPSLVPLRRRCIADRPSLNRTAWSARDRTSPRLCMRLMWAWDSRLGSHQIGGAAPAPARGSQVATRNRRVKQSLPGPGVWFRRSLPLVLTV
jgi:hypothetical protein